MKRTSTAQGPVARLDVGAPGAPLLYLVNRSRNCLSLCPTFLSLRLLLLSSTDTVYSNFNLLRTVDDSSVNSCTLTPSVDFIVCRKHLLCPISSHIQCYTEFYFITTMKILYTTLLIAGSVLAFVNAQVLGPIYYVNGGGNTCLGPLGGVFDSQLADGTPVMMLVY